MTEPEQLRSVGCGPEGHSGRDCLGTTHRRRQRSVDGHHVTAVVAEAGQDRRRPPAGPRSGIRSTPEGRSRRSEARRSCCSATPRRRRWASLDGRGDRGARSRACAAASPGRAVVRPVPGVKSWMLTLLLDTRRMGLRPSRLLTTIYPTR